MQLTPLATGSLERSLLVFSTPRGLTSNDLSRLFFTYTNTSQAATCTCNTQPRISPHNIVNHSSHKEATNHRSSNHTWSSHAQNSGPWAVDGIEYGLHQYSLIGQNLCQFNGRGWWWQDNIFSSIFALVHF
jgi:hypothetical protein